MILNDARGPRTRQELCMDLPVAIHRDGGTVYGVTIPDVPGCHSWGDSIGEALSHVREAIYAHFETLAELNEDGREFKASRIDQLRTNVAYKDAIWAIVSIDPADFDATPERINISVPRFALRRIDRYIRQHHDSRSGFLVRAALDELERQNETR